MALKPASLSDAEAAALPLTAITAWEMLFDRLDIRRPVPGAADAIVIVGGAGGVGSTAIQLVRALTDVGVIATAFSLRDASLVRTTWWTTASRSGEQVAARGIGPRRCLLHNTSGYLICISTLAWRLVLSRQSRQP